LAELEARAGRDLVGVLEEAEHELPSWLAVVS
jgi:hypothetical protein